MTLSRWKLMAGVLGVSLGGLAAIAGPCSKSDANKTARSSDPPPGVELPPPPAVPPAGSGSAPKLPGPAVPPTKGPELPPPPPPAPAPAGDLPKLPMPAGEPSSAPVLPSLPAPEPKTPAGGPALPPPPAPAVDLPKPTGGTPALPGLPAEPPKPMTTAPAVDAPKIEFSKPPAAPPAATPPAVALDPPVVKPAADPLPDLAGSPVKPAAMTAPAAPPVAAVANAAAKFRIVLRVGEGEPTFEVRCGDDLLMKVVCEKVDVKSPEKGSGLSEVTAKGNVRFAGFGATGTCEGLVFQAGSGAVQMSGNVNIQVKDKLGRVESEMSAATITYKLDSCPTGGSIKP